MPSGATHDRITLWSLPVVAGMASILTESGELTLLVAGGYLFGGLMLSPDLDLRSRPYKRWGWLRWIWLPYQKMLRHRSFFSHGPIVGTTLRVVYLASWLAIGGFISLVIVQFFSEVPWSLSQVVLLEVKKLLFNYPWEGIAIFVGLELGALSHGLCDAISSTMKRYRRKGKKRRRRAK